MDAKRVRSSRIIQRNPDRQRQSTFHTRVVRRLGKTRRNYCDSMACPQVLSKKAQIACGVGVLLAVLISLGLVLTIKDANSGGGMSFAPTDIHLVGGLSSFWCSGQTITLMSPNSAKSPHVNFTTHLINGVPELSKVRRVADMVKVMSELPVGGRSFWRFYLNADSRINLLHCAASTDVYMFLFRGHDLIENCIQVAVNGKDWGFSRDVPDIRNGLENLGKYMYNRDVGKHRRRKSSDSGEVGENSGGPLLATTVSPRRECSKVTLIKDLKIKKCRGNKQVTSLRVLQDDFYIILYLNRYTDPTEINTNITLDRPAYDLSRNVNNCTSFSNCILPLQFGVTERVVVQLGPTADSGDIPTSQGDDFERNIHWSCNLRVATIVIFPAGLPFILISLVVIYSVRTCKICGAKKNVQSTGSAEESADRNEVVGRADSQIPYSSVARSTIPEEPTEDEPIFADPTKVMQIDRNYGSMGRSNIQQPSAPPLSQHIPPALEEPVECFHPYPEPPPTYDETMETDRQHEPLLPQKC